MKKTILTAVVGMAGALLSCGSIRADTVITLDIAVNSVSGMNPPSFQPYHFTETWTLTDYFAAAPQYFDFGGGFGMLKATAGGSASVSPSSNADVLAAAGLTAADIHAGFYAENAAYFLNGVSDGTNTGDVQLSNQATQLTAVGDGTFFYKNYYQSLYFNLSGTSFPNVVTITPEVLATYLSPGMTVGWNESGYLYHNPNSFSLGDLVSQLSYNGTATVVSVQDTSVPDGGATVAMLGLALAGITSLRRRFVRGGAIGLTRPAVRRRFVAALVASAASPVFAVSYSTSIFLGFGNNSSPTLTSTAGGPISATGGNGSTFTNFGTANEGVGYVSATATADSNPSSAGAIVLAGVSDSLGIFASPAAGTTGTVTFRFYLGLDGDVTHLGPAAGGIDLLGSMTAFGTGTGFTYTESVFGFVSSSVNFPTGAFSGVEALDFTTTFEFNQYYSRTAGFRMIAQAQSQSIDGFVHASMGGSIYWGGVLAVRDSHGALLDDAAYQVLDTEHVDRSESIFNPVESVPDGGATGALTLIAMAGCMVSAVTRRFRTAT